MKASGGQAVLFCCFHFFGDFLVHFLTDLVDAEARRALARRVVDEGLQELRCSAGAVEYQVVVLGQEIMDRQKLHRAWKVAGCRLK